MPFEFRELEIPGVVLIEPKVFEDERGCFMETYKRSDFAAAGITEQFVQDNHSASARGVLRGLHFQKGPNAQGKLVRCVRGKVFDVVADIRRDSPTFGKWASVELSGDNRKIIYVPAGLAHGFLALSGGAEVLYKCTKEYSPANESGIIWNDPDLDIDWPVKEPILSARDIKLPTLGEGF
jgi:dTDP-4-dehydrorhamnose 3,5-epimerase